MGGQPLMERASGAQPSEGPWRQDQDRQLDRTLHPLVHSRLRLGNDGRGPSLLSNGPKAYICRGGAVDDAARAAPYSWSIVMRACRGIVLLAAVATAGCSWQGPSLAGYPGLQYRVISYYDGRAMERGANCPNPELQTITGTRVIEETPERVVMEVRYYWVDWSQATDVRGANVTTCRDWSARTFTFTRNTDGNLLVESMTGAQKQA